MYATFNGGLFHSAELEDTTVVKSYEINNAYFTLTIVEYQPLITVRLSTNALIPEQMLGSMVLLPKLGLDSSDTERK